MGRVIRVSLTGERAKLGEFAARDFAALVIGVERTLARACGHIVGRHVKARGRRERLIERATRLRLVAVEPGSVVGVLELPDLTTSEGEEFGLSDEGLAETALDQTLASAAGETEGYRDVIRSLVQLTEDLGVGTRYEALVLEEASPRRQRQPVVLDLAARERLRRLFDPEPTAAPGSLVGVLVEADFEHHTARLRTAARHAIEVKFDDALSDQIQEALRQEASLEGEVAYDRETLVARSVKLRRIERPQQLILDSGASEFWRGRTVPQLAIEQGLGGRSQSLSALKVHEGTPEEIEAFFAALRRDAG
jgi:hypothetical protein